jgi:hypothetical protein
MASSLTEYRIVPCEYCGTEGRLYERRQYFCRHTGYHDDDVDVGPCPECDGTGGAMVVVEPIEEYEAALPHSEFTTAAS